jgi:hypothetical protein
VKTNKYIEQCGAKMFICFVLFCDVFSGNPVALQIFTVIPLTYLSVCAYWPLFQSKQNIHTNQQQNQ